MTTRTIRAFDGGLSFKIEWRPLITASVLLAAIAAVFMISLLNGNSDIAATDVLTTVLGHPPSDEITTIVFQFRLPRTVVAILVGAMFAVSGAILQYLTRNPLADPSLVGVSQGAALAVVIAFVIFPNVTGFAIPFLTFLGGMAVAGLIQLITATKQGDTPLRFILTGVGVAAFIASCTSTLLVYGDVDRAQSALTWLAGSLHAIGPREMGWIIVISVVLFVIMLTMARPLSALRFGPELATSFGLNLGVIGSLMLVGAVALAATGVAAVGPLGFVGLVAPHIARRLARAGVGMHLLLTAFTGALLVASADLIGRTAFENAQVPAGIITAVLGVPVLVMILLKKQN